MQADHVECSVWACLHTKASQVLRASMNVPHRGGCHNQVLLAGTGDVSVDDQKCSYLDDSSQLGYQMTCLSKALF